MAAAMAKTFASDVAMEVAVEAVQTMGSYGYMPGLPGGENDADAGDPESEGTNEIQRNIIAQELIKRAAKGR